MFARNKVLFMDETPWGEGHEYMNETGGPMGAGLQYRAIGIFRDQAALDSYPHLDAARPGDLIFEDVDGDGKITSLDRVRQNLTGFPEIIFGLNLSADWKNFDISVLFQGQARAVKDVISRMDATSNFYKWRAEDRWTEDNIDEMCIRDRLVSGVRGLVCNYPDAVTPGRNNGFISVTKKYSSVNTDYSSVK